MPKCIWIVNYRSVDEIFADEVLVDTTCGYDVADEVLRWAESDFTHCPYCGCELELKYKDVMDIESYEYYIESEVDRIRDEQLFNEQICISPFTYQVKSQIITKVTLAASLAANNPINSDIVVY